MSLRVIGYRGGRPIHNDEGPNAAVSHQRVYGTRAAVGGSMDFALPGHVDVQRVATRIAMRRLRVASREQGL